MFTDRLQYLVTISKFYKHQLQLFLQSISLLSVFKRISSRVCGEKKSDIFDESRADCWTLVQSQILIFSSP